MTLLPRFQLYLLIGLAFAAGLIGVHFAGVQRGIARAEEKVNAGRLDAMGRAKDVEDEIDALDDRALRERAARWLRR